MGGTFTDVVASDEALAEIRSAKVPTRRDDPIEGLIEAIGAVGLTWQDVGQLIHGTTMVTNDIIEGLMDDVALVSTKGFSDTIAIGRVRRRHIYRLDLPPKLPPLVPEHLRFEVDERIDWKGEVARALSEDEIERIVAEVRASGVRAVAICLIHGYRNPVHERMLATALAQVVPHLCLSHMISPEIREYERTNTTVLSAAVINRVSAYLDRIETRRPAQSHLAFFHSSGGMAAPAIVREHPLLLAMSGPAAGVGAAVVTLDSLGIDKALTFDMGGTTTDTCLIVDGRAEISSDRELGDRRIRLPMVSVHSIGSGGGSIARLDAGAVVVGPRSAGAFPGPACYGLGGVEPTITDANVVLGYLGRDRILGKAIRVDYDAAADSVETIARETGRSIDDAALGILAVAHSNMVRALKRVTVERGIDGRECTLVAYGGSGPMHAAFVAEQYGIRNVLVPASSSSYSALGCLTAQMSHSRQRTVNMRSADWNPVEIRSICRGLKSALAASLARSGCQANECVLEFAAMMRYRGQSYEVSVIDAALHSIALLSRQFYARHEEMFGFVTDEPWELVAIRATMRERRRKRLATAESPDDGRIEIMTRRCVFPETGPTDTKICARARIPVGGNIPGPAIIEDEWSTVLIPPRAVFRMDEQGNIHISVGEGR